MADQEDEELKMALKLSMQHESPEPKRSKPGEDASVAGTGGGGAEGESLEARNRRMQRELMAAAAEKRMLAAKKAAAAAAPVAAAEKSVKEGKSGGSACTISTESKDKKVNSAKSKGKSVNSGRELSEAQAHRLFLMIFGNEVTKDILAQWSNQGTSGKDEYVKESTEHLSSGIEYPHRIRVHIACPEQLGGVDHRSHISRQVAR